MGACNSRNCGAVSMADRAVGAGNGIGSNHKIEATSSGSHFYLSLTLIRKLFLVVQSEGIKKYLGHEATITVGKKG